MNPIIGYVAGYGRSGSTFLDVVIDNSPSAFGGGEITHLFDSWLGGEPCSCGELLDECPVWSLVIGQVANTVPEFDAGEARRITRRLEHMLIPVLHSRKRVKLRYERLWRAVFIALEDVTGHGVILDSSKTQVFAAFRSRLLKRCLPRQVYVVHLVRDPRNVVASVLRGGNRIAAKRRSKVLSACRTALTWIAANVCAHIAARGAEKLSVRYEDLVSDRERRFEEIGNFLKIEVSPVAERVTAGEAIATGHGISGNRLRRQPAITMNPDVRSEQEWSGLLRCVALITWPLARNYGYGRIRRANAKAG